MCVCVCDSVFLSFLIGIVRSSQRPFVCFICLQARLYYDPTITTDIARRKREAVEKAAAQQRDRDRAAAAERDRADALRIAQAREQAAQREWKRLKEAQINAAINACAARTFPGFSSYIGVVQVAIGPSPEQNQWCAVTLPPLLPAAAAAGGKAPLVFQRVTGNLLRDEAAAAREYDTSVKGLFGPAAITNFVQSPTQPQQGAQQPGASVRNSAAIVPVPSCLEEVCVLAFV